MLIQTEVVGGYGWYYSRYTTINEWHQPSTSFPWFHTLDRKIEAVPVTRYSGAPEDGRLLMRRPGYPITPCDIINYVGPIESADSWFFRLHAIGRDEVTVSSYFAATLAMERQSYLASATVELRSSIMDVISELFDIRDSFSWDSPSNRWSLEKLIKVLKDFEEILTQFQQSLEYDVVLANRFYAFNTSVAEPGRLIQFDDQNSTINSTSPAVATYDIFATHYDYFNGLQDVIVETGSFSFMIGRFNDHTPPLFLLGEDIAHETFDKYVELLYDFANKFPTDLPDEIRIARSPTEQMTYNITYEYTDGVLIFYNDADGQYEIRYTIPPVTERIRYTGSVSPDLPDESDDPYLDLLCDVYNGSLTYTI
jgi:hypothetical protein